VQSFDNLFQMGILCSLIKEFSVQIGSYSSYTPLNVIYVYLIFYSGKIHELNTYQLKVENLLKNWEFESNFYDIKNSNLMECKYILNIYKIFG
jgi:hypothetical protein